MIFPLMVLALGAIFYGFLTRDLMIGLGSLYYNSINTNYHNFTIIDSEFLHVLVKNIPFFFTIFGALLSLFLINCFNANKTAIFNLKINNKIFYIFLNKKWHFDQIINEAIVVKLMNFGYFSTFQSLDKGLIEKFGPTGFTSVVSISSAGLSTYNNGLFFRVVFFIISFTLFFLTYYLVILFEISFIFNLNFFLFVYTFMLSFLFESKLQK